MHPVLLRWGGYTVYWYSALMCLGIVAGVAYAQWQGRRMGLRDLQVLDGALWALAGGLVGARAAYVIPNWADYATDPWGMVSLGAGRASHWGGGLVFQGGLLGGLLALGLYGLWARLSLLRLADLAAPAVALGQSLGWVGALLHGANYGLVARSPFSLWLPDLYGVYGPRFPTQALAAALALLLFYGLHRLRARRLRSVPAAQRRGLRAGMSAMIYLSGNGLGHLLLEFTRGDEAPYVGVLRTTQWLELAEAAVACAFLLYFWKRRGASTHEE